MLEGRFDAGYLELPERVVITAMQSHQRYFPVRRVGAPLEPRFLFVSNGGDPDVVRAGNEEVLVGRLDDAAFAHRRDLERGLEAMAAELHRVSFLEGSGSLADKVARLGPIVERLCDRNGLSDTVRAAAVRAAALCKADLVSGLVSEFADLEGYAGSIYAGAAGEDEAVCAAIEEHHRPREAGGELPASAAGAVLAVADKADTLAVAFRLGLEPTGSRDPFGLRRAAAGIVAIALDRGYRLDPHDLLEGRAAVFVLDRLEPPLLDEGVTVEEVRAARGSEATEPVEVAALARALHAFAGPRPRRRPRRVRPLCAHRRRGACRPCRRGASLRALRARALARAGRSAGNARGRGQTRAGRKPVLRRRPRHGRGRGGPPQPADAGRKRGRGVAPARRLRAASGLSGA